MEGFWCVLENIKLANYEDRVIVTAVIREILLLLRLYSVSTLDLKFYIHLAETRFLCYQMLTICKQSESYVSFGFTKVIRNSRDCAQCLHCSVVMSSALLRPSKLKNHCDKKHPQKKDKDIDALSAEKVRYDLEATLPHLGFTVEEKPNSMQLQDGISICEV